MTEYLILTGITLPWAFYLYHPDNGLYQGARSLYDTTSMLLTWLGP
jgi:hypothetical protein